MFRYLAQMCALVLVLSWVAEQDYAQTRVWFGANGASYHVAANWLPTDVPDTPAEVAQFSGGTGGVVINTDVTIDILNKLGGIHTFFASGPATPVTIFSDETRVSNATSGGILTLAQSTGTSVVNLDIATLLRVGNEGILNITEGSTVTSSELSLGAISTGDGTILVDGPGSNLDITGSVPSEIGEQSSTGTLTVQNDASASFADILNLADSAIADSSAVVNVLSGGSVVANDAVNVGTGTTTGQSAILTVSGMGTSASSFTQTGIAGLTVGSSVSGNSAAVNVNNGGIFTTGTGQTTVNLNGALNIAGGTFNANGEIKNSGGSLTLNGGAINANNGLETSGGQLDFAKGTITVTNGAFAPPTSQFFMLGGTNPFDTSHLILGAGATMNFNSSMLVGFPLGDGELTITDGASVTTTLGGLYPRGHVTVEGDTSTWTVASLLPLGGSLHIQNGGDVISDDIPIDANELDPTEEGTISVDGMGSTLTSNATLAVGDETKGELMITDQGLASNVTGIIGNQAVAIGTATVDGSGSRWANSTSLTVGQQGQGTLHVAAGSAVSSRFGYIGREAGSTGTATISGSDSEWTNVNLYVGGDSSTSGGSAQLRILDGGLVDVSGALTIWDQGTLLLNGGTLRVDSTATTGSGTINYLKGTFHLTDAGGYTVGANSGPIDEALGLANAIIPAGGGFIVEETLLVPSGTSLTVVASDLTAESITNDSLINMTNGTLTTTTGLTNNADMVLVDTTVEGNVDNTSGSTVTVLGTVDFNGLVSGPGNFFGPGTANFIGGMAPGASPAEVTFEGGISLGTTNKLFIELGGTIAGSEFDALEINGAADLGRTLEVSLLGNFDPQVGQFFRFIHANGGIFNSFDSVNLPTLSGGKIMQLVYGETIVGLEVLSPFTADFDRDGDVDGRDFLVWQRGGSPSPMSGSDLAAWQAQYGSSLPLFAATTTVPEPSGLFCAIALVLAFAAFPAAELRLL